MVADSTIVIPTLNRHERVRSLLLNLCELPTLPKKVIVVEQGVPQDIREIFSRLTEAGVSSEYIVSGFKSAAFARNIGLIQTDTSELIYLDDDVKPESDIVSEFAIALEEHAEVQCAVGNVICRHPVATVAEANTFQPEETYVPLGLSSAVVFRRDFLLSFGGFNSLIPYHGEETELFMRMGLAKMMILNAKKALVLHLVHQSGGTRETKFHSFKWYLDFLRSNSTRIVRLHSVLLLLPWLIKNLGFIREAYGAGSLEENRLQSLMSSILDGMRLGRISRKTDPIALTYALHCSGLDGPNSFLSSPKRDQVLTEAERIAKIEDQREKLSYIRNQIPISYSAGPELK